MYWATVLSSQAIFLSLSVALGQNSAMAQKHFTLLLYFVDKVHEYWRHEETGFLYQSIPVVAIPPPRQLPRQP